MIAADVVRFFETFAPPALAAEWDNVGLLLGDAARTVARLMTCLTISPAVVDEAVAERVDLVVAHHPLPFRPLKRITADTHEGRLLWRLATAGVGVYSPHTAFDSAADGINRLLADGLGLIDVEPLEPLPTSADPSVGVGRRGRLPQPLRLAELVAVAKRLLGIAAVDVVGDDERRIERVGVACGSAGELLGAAVRSGCDCFVTGEARFHTAVEADAAGTTLLLVGHYPGERYGIEHLARTLAAAFPQLAVWAARRETDPLRRA